VNVSGVGEQSHKSEMGAALRGDFERLRARRGGAGEGVLQAPRPGAEPVAAAVQHALEPAPTSVTAPLSGPTESVAVEAHVERASAPAVGEPAGEPPRGSWLDRLRGRR
jgi:hypothetical protein